MRIYVRDLAARFARVMQIRCPLSKQRAQGRPGADCTRGLVCQTHSNRRTRAYRFSRNSPAFPTQWLYGLLRALPGERAFLPPSLLRSLLLKNLTPASRRQDHTTSPYALAFSSGVKKRLTPKRPPHSGPTHRDDRETPLLWAGMAEDIILISRIVKRNIFDFGAYRILQIRSDLPRLRAGRANARPLARHDG